MLAKLEQLASFSRQNITLPERFPRSPGALINAAATFAKAVDRAAIESLKKPDSLDTELISDLFAFLADLPRPICRDMQRLAAFSPEPARAWQETRSDSFWKLAALIQDVWEHTFGPEALDDVRILTALRGLEARRALDFGSGAGYFAFRLARAGVQVTCLETNPVKRAFLRFRRARRREGRRIRLRLSERRYDLVLAINVLDHLRNPVRAVRRIASHASVGAALVCRAAFPEDSWHAGGRSLKESVYQELLRHFHYPAQRRQNEHDVILMMRRRAQKPRQPEARGRLTVRLHPAATLAPDPANAQQFILWSPRFYTHPVIVTQEGVALVDLCRRPRTWDQIVRAASELGAPASEVQQALQQLHEAHLILTF